MSVREAAERHWNGEGDLVHREHPVHAGTGAESEELEDGLLYFKSIASVATLDTGDGLVMLDTGSQFDVDNVHAGVRGWRPNALVTEAVFSHHHIDHVFGTKRFEEDGDPVVVYAHEEMPAHFARYQKTRGWNGAINSRQFGFGLVDMEWPEEYRIPDVTYADATTFRRGDLTFELRHARGETDDATWTWVPERKILHPGDLFIWAVPNAGNPQKVQRYLSDWATALREMAALGPEIMLAGHGLPIFGRDRVVAALTDTAELLDSIESQTIELMNLGKPLTEVIHTVEVPAHLREKPYLRPVYDHPQFLVRNVWRRYGGWHDGEPDNLLPAPRAQQAREWVALAGGVGAVLDRVRALVDADDLRMACHLLEFAVLAEPASSEAHEVRAEVYKARARQQESSMARNILNHAALSSEQGLRDHAGRY